MKFTALSPVQILSSRLNENLPAIAWLTFALAVRVILNHACMCAPSRPTLRPHGLQPTRLLCPWGFPGKNPGAGTSLVVRWLRLRSPNAGGQGLIPSQGTRSHMPQLTVCMSQLKIPHTATKT